jgi:uracil-DNA glycosylase family 4
MSLQSQTQELLELVHETQKNLKYLQELGVEGIQRHDNDISPVVKHEQSSNSARSLASGKQTLHRRIDPVTKAETSNDGSTSLFGDLTPQPARLAPSTETFEEIWLEVGDCTRCPLHQGRTNVVHTEGNRKARLMFVGEAPGADEDAQARPFVGRAGQLLTKIIEAIGLKREEVLIGNVNRCRPPGNRPPTLEEASMCKPFLLREIAIVQPEVIVVMGNTAMRNLLDTKEGITKLRGQFQDYKGIKVMPTFHPAYLLRDPSKKRETWEDLKKVREYLDHSANKRA